MQEVVEAFTVLGSLFEKECKIKWKSEHLCRVRKRTTGNYKQNKADDLRNPVQTENAGSPVRKQERKMLFKGTKIQSFSLYFAVSLGVFPVCYLMF